MRPSTRILLGALAALLVLAASPTPARAHDARSYPNQAAQAATPAGARTAPVPGISGQGKLRFRVLYTADQLPEAARKVLVNAHGGFAVDRRPGRGETYFALPGAGILSISADLKSIRLLDTAAAMKDVNLHDTTIWFGEDRTPYLVFPANDAHKVFTTTLDGKLVNTLDAPTADDQFEAPEVHDYFLGGGNFAPTDVEYLDGLYYVTTGYSNLDFVLTARIMSTSPFVTIWNDLAFGGKGEAHGKFGTAHGITVPPGTKLLDISDRPHSRIERFSRYGHYLESLEMPSGSLPCDIDYMGHYAIVAALDGPDTSKGAPLYILDNRKLVSTIMPKEDLGLANFKHNHNAVLREIGGRLYIIVQAWNPGDFAILEQVAD
ncbi:MAG TPA: hypothetical protein VKU44_09815 [Terriglobia bacterium]|nr:hypothetical protein [Terriglobia bacterium]